MYFFERISQVLTSSLGKPRVSKACLVVHQIQHGDWLVVCELAFEKILGQILFYICFKVNLAFFPKLHDADPDGQLGGRAPLEN